MIFFFISVATFLVQCSADASLPANLKTVFFVESDFRAAAYTQDRFTPGGGILSIP